MQVLIDACKKSVADKDGIFESAMRFLLKGRMQSTPNHDPLEEEKNQANVQDPNPNMNGGSDEEIIGKINQGAREIENEGARNAARLEAAQEEQVIQAAMP